MIDQVQVLINGPFPFRNIGVLAAALNITRPSGAVHMSQSGIRTVEPVYPDGRRNLRPLRIAPPGAVASVMCNYRDKIKIAFPAWGLRFIQSSMPVLHIIFLSFVGGK